jgi:hypothetical protein
MSVSIPNVIVHGKHTSMPHVPHINISLSWRPLIVFTSLYMHIRHVKVVFGSTVSLENVTRRFIEAPRTSVSVTPQLSSLTVQPPLSLVGSASSSFGQNASAIAFVIFLMILQKLFQIHIEFLSQHTLPLHHLINYIYYIVKNK